jgi:hypothetical protein
VYRHMRRPVLLGIGGSNEARHLVFAVPLGPVPMGRHTTQGRQPRPYFCVTGANMRLILGLIDFILGFLALTLIFLIGSCSIAAWHYIH